MNHRVPSYILTSMHRYHLFGMSEESFIIHINSIAGTGFARQIIMNYIIDFGFFDLSFGPIWETGLRISRPTSIAFSRAMVTDFWDGRFNTCKLFLVDFCEMYKHNDDTC
jgi:hypothetical protein